MKNINPNGEYKLLVHSIDGTVSIYHLDKSKFTLYTFGRGDKGSAHLSTKLPPDDKNDKGLHCLSSMQCYFAWDPEENDWVVGNGKPPDKYIPAKARKVFAHVSEGPTGEHNRVYICPNATEEYHSASSNYRLLEEPARCASVLGVAFIKGTQLTFNGEPLPVHSGKRSQILGWTSDKETFAYLIEILSATNPLDNIRITNKKSK